MKIKISKDYSKTPGGRFKSEGAYSGEDFRESILFPKYNEAKKAGDTLIVDLDGGYGYRKTALGISAEGCKINNQFYSVKLHIILTCILLPTQMQ